MCHRIQRIFWLQVCQYTSRHEVLKIVLRYSWGPIPWLYPPEVYIRSHNLYVEASYMLFKDPSSHGSCEGCLTFHCNELGFQLFGWRNYTLFARSDNVETVSNARLFLRL